MAFSPGRMFVFLSGRRAYTPPVPGCYPVGAANGRAPIVDVDGFTPVLAFGPGEDAESGGSV